MQTNGGSEVINIHQCLLVVTSNEWCHMGANLNPCLCVTMLIGIYMSSSDYVMVLQENGQPSSSRYQSSLFTEVLNVTTNGCMAFDYQTRNNFSVHLLGRRFWNVCIIIAHNTRLVRNKALVVCSKNHFTIIIINGQLFDGDNVRHEMLLGLNHEFPS